MHAIYQSLYLIGSQHLAFPHSYMFIVSLSLKWKFHKGREFLCLVYCHCAQGLDIHWIRSRLHGDSHPSEGQTYATKRRSSGGRELVELWFPESSQLAPLFTIFIHWLGDPKLSSFSL